MTITTGGPPKRSQPVALVRGFLAGGVIGASLAALVVGVIIESVPLLVTGLGLGAFTWLFLFLAGRPARIREAELPPRTALAMIESLIAKPARGESSDIAVLFDLTVAPDDTRAYRVEITQEINLVELADYRPRGILVVRYPPDRPWQVTIVKRPTPEWEDRAAAAHLDSAPGPAVPPEPTQGCSVGFLALLGLLLGAATVILLFRTELFDQDDQGDQETARPSVSATSSTSTSVESSSSGTVTLGPGQSFLDKGELRRAVDSLTKGRTEDTRAALTLVVQERLLTVQFAPTGTRASRFDPRSLPYDRVPALVEDATSTLGVHSPSTWQLTAERLTGSLTLRISVTGPEGTGSLEADAQGKVLRRTPAP